MCQVRRTRTWCSGRHDIQVVFTLCHSLRHADLRRCFCPLCAARSFVFARPARILVGCRPLWAARQPMSPSCRLQRAAEIRAFACGVSHSFGHADVFRNGTRASEDRPLREPATVLHSVAYRVVMQPKNTMLHERSGVPRGCPQISPFGQNLSDRIA